ncbi:MAG: hypothetical protein IJV58_10695 [Oscillospiraceae bacterium]|nr:hypothetical protein [Lachnospiraceae bacterium]MBQ9696874.1 hypothetical protein [Oscillospiraceae bacterium]
MDNERGKIVKNWIYYYKWYVVAGVLLLIFAVRYIAGILGVAEPRPDLQAAYVGRHVLSEETITALQDLLASKAGDFNGDGKVLVTVHQYLTSDETDIAEAQQSASAAEISLVGDIDGCESYLFLLEDPQQFQIEWQILADSEGNPPAADDYSVEGKVTPLTDFLPDLRAVAAEEDRDVLSSLMVGRRCFYTEKTCENAEALAAMWDDLLHQSSLITAAGNASDSEADAAGNGSGSDKADSAGSGTDTSKAADPADKASEEADVKDSTKPALPEADENGMFVFGNNISAPRDWGQMALNEYNEALAANGFYYAAWTSGTPSAITNSEGEEALLYPVQLYMITYEGTDPDDAGSKASGWLAQARKNYKITNETTYTANGREYVILEYTYKDSSNPYAQGCSAFLTSADETAICAELVSVEPQDTALPAQLKSFLDRVR